MKPTLIERFALPGIVFSMILTAYVALYHHRTDLAIVFAFAGVFVAFVAWTAGEKEGPP